MSYDDVINSLITTEVNEICVPDNIAGVNLSECAAELAGPLTILFIVSLNYGTFPTTVKGATGVPVCKKGVNGNVCHDIPMYLLTLFSKLLEKVVHESL